MEHFWRIDIPEPAYYVPYTVFAIGYFVLGHFLTRADIGHKSRRIIYVAAVFGLLVCIVGTYFCMSRSDGTWQGYFYDHFSPNVILLAAAIFLACSKVNWEKRLPDGSRESRFPANASKASLGIYLIHPLFLEALSQIGIDARFVHPLLAIPLISIATMAASFTAVRPKFYSGLPGSSVICHFRERGRK